MLRCIAGRAAIFFLAISTSGSRGRMKVQAQWMPATPDPFRRTGAGGTSATTASARVNSGGPYAAIPEEGLGSNSNYFLYSPAPWVSVGARAALKRRPGIGFPVITPCNHLLGLSVHIIVDTDITGTNGFGFQINAYRLAENTMVRSSTLCCSFHSSSPSLTCVVNNWHSKQE